MYLKLIKKIKIMEEKIKFYFPTKELTEDDYLPVNISILKNYYRNTFLQLIDKVRKIFKLIA